MALGSGLRLKHKLIAMQLATACAVLFFYAAFTLISSMRLARGAVMEQMRSAADLLGASSASALDFSDPETARKVLASLEAEPDLAGGWIYDAQGRVFAEYVRAGRSGAAPPVPAGESWESSGGYATVTRRIRRGDEVLGTILLRSDMGSFRRAQALNVVLVLVMLLAALGLALLLALRTQRTISGPILRLVAAAQEVSRTGRYSSRVEPGGSDEIGALCVSFNDMIAEIEKRESRLRVAQQELEERVRDRTAALKEESSKLCTANEQLGAIFEAATSGIVQVKARVIVRCNRRMDELFGYAPGEMVGKTTRMWYPGEADFVAIGQETAAAMKAGRTFFREQLLVRKDGSTFWGRMTAQAADRADPSKGLVGIIDDITAEREYADALKKAAEAAQSADRLKSAFLATMSHELRTPLNSIIGFSGILMQELPGRLNDEQKKQLGMVRESADHLLALINDVLDISKIEAGQLQVSAEPFDLREAVEKASLTAQPLAGKKGLSLELDIAPEVGMVVGDRRRVEQVLLNLLSNAVKFTDRGSVRIVCSAGEHAASIRIADSGIGIRPEDLPTLFKPFRQIDTGIARQYEGTGLGLSICKRLLELMGGTIRAESEWGKGSVFSVTLPVGRDRV